MAEEITDVELEIIKDLVERLSRLQEEYESLVKLKGLRDDEREDIDYIRKTNEKVIELLSDLQAYIISHDKLSDDIDELNEMLIYTRRWWVMAERRRVEERIERRITTVLLRRYRSISSELNNLIPIIKDLRFRLIDIPIANEALAIVLDTVEFHLEIIEDLIRLREVE